MKKSLFNFDSYENFSPSMELEHYIHSILKPVLGILLILTPIFIFLDFYFQGKETALYFIPIRAAGFIIFTIQFGLLWYNKPSRFSLIHGYITNTTLAVMISLITAHLGGFDSRFVDGLKFAIIGSSLLLPWKAVHTFLNGMIVLAIYIIINGSYHLPYDPTILSLNILFLGGTIVISTSISYSRNNFIMKEYSLRSDLKKTRDMLINELDAAKSIQTALLPSISSLENYSLSSEMVPFSDMGGDYFDIIKNNFGEKFLAVGDVSGHGMESGLVSMMTQSALFAAINLQSDRTPSDLLKQVNTGIVENIKRMESAKYMTLMIAKLEDDHMIVAGRHNDVIVFRKKTSSLDKIEIKGTWVGIEETLEIEQENYRIDIDVGDTVLFYTDGIPEALLPDGSIYSEERLFQVFQNHGGEDSEDIKDAILSDFLNASERIRDDYSLIILKRIS